MDARDNIGYWLGSRFGREWLVRHGRRFGITDARVDRSEAFFARQGPKAVFVGRFVGFARALVPFVAGASRMPYRRGVNRSRGAVRPLHWTLLPGHP